MNTTIPNNIIMAMGGLSFMKRPYIREMKAVDEKTLRIFTDPGHNNINIVEVSMNGRDAYTMRFIEEYNMVETARATYNDVYSDSLTDVFFHVTRFDRHA